MRLQHKVVFKRLIQDIARLKSLARFPRRWFSWAVIFIFMLAVLACAMIGPSQSAPRRVVVRVHLPTLTPTPLPTQLPPLPNEAEPVPAAPTSTPVLAPILTPASIDPAASTAAASPANSESMLTALVSLNVRAGPGLDYPIVGQLAQGQSVQVIGQNPEGSWWQIIYPPDSGSLAWVIADIQYSTVDNAGGMPVAQLSPEQPPAPTEQAPPSAGLPSSPTPAPPPTVISGPAGWAFAGVRLSPNQEDGGLVLYGNAINQTGVSQELSSVTGIFYDGQGQVIADASKTYAYWPSYVVPADGSMPFELSVEDIASATRYDLSVEAEPSSESPRQDFEFAEVNQWTEDDTYCVEGVVHNSGNPLAEYLVVAAVLYDSQNNLVNFSDEGELDLEAGSGNSPFEICVNLSNQQVARHELQAWGR
jgi:hypothetical protein